MQSWRSWQIDPPVQNARFQAIKMSIDESTAAIREAHEFRVETYSRVNEKWTPTSGTAPRRPAGATRTIDERPRACL
jgi:hypothetical protein